MRTRTAQKSVSKPTTSQTRAKTCPFGERNVLMPISQPSSNRNSVQNDKFMKRKLDDYIRMEKIFLNFRKTGEFKTKIFL